MTEQRTIGVFHDVSIAVAAWDGAGAAVDLSFACMFEREITGTGPTGGLRHLDDALGGALTELRRAGYFRANPMETLLVSRPPAPVVARAVMVVGLGDPSVWSPAVTAAAAATAARAAVQQKALSAAFAPSLLDAGLAPSATSGVAAVMLAAVAGAIAAQVRIAAIGLAPPLSLRQWVFDVGAAHFDTVAEQFRLALERLDPAA
ncbi:M17 family peptidase N-terminal domain-containing protein [Dyella sp. Tek66A03]|uniref:M17 family peptidase N-terminal domain-containing protein n=1 Tax=Dyella sp. Tek66A03 TaxID=3458298 RepID=UPI00403E5AC8